MTNKAPQSSDEFHALLNPVRTTGQQFIGHSLPLDSPAIFGGQLMAQALGCAEATLDEPRPAHYLQSSFVAAGDPRAELEFEVTSVRDGKSTSHRLVEVCQQGTTLLLASISFQATGSGYDHQINMPPVAKPESLLRDPASKFSFSGDGDNPFPFTMLTCPEAPGEPQATSSIWAKSRDVVATDEPLHQQLFTFLSDATILQSALSPHQLSWDEPGLLMATMNHSIWFHRRLDINDWLLLHSESPSTGSGRAFSTANTFDASGKLVATLAQEGILRLRSP